MKTGFTAGAFDLGPHAGHLALFKEAKQYCDHLVVGIHVNPKLERPEKNKPVPNLVERQATIMACIYVDSVWCYETEADLITLLKLVKPNIRFLGDDYINKPFTGSDLEIETRYVSRQHGISSSEIRRQVMEQAFSNINSQRP